MVHSPFQIAIDGPVAAGKGTVSIGLAKKLGFLYVDTGAMYRVSALLALRKGISLDDEASIVGEVRGHNIEMEMPKGVKEDGRLITVLLDGTDVSWEIRTEEVGIGASKVGVLKSLRLELVRQQQKIANNHDVIMEGRDIGIRVLPQANLKIYLDADIDVRALRKQKQLESQGEKLELSEVKKNILDRDTREMTRDMDPLRPAPDAWILDTTRLSSDEVVAQISTKVRLLQKGK